MDDPSCRRLYASCFKFWFKQNFFNEKNFDCNHNPIYPTFFCWLLQFLHLATIKRWEQEAPYTIIHFYLCFQIFLCILRITSSGYSVYQLSDKAENSPFSTQICPENWFRYGISENQSKNKIQHPQYLGSKSEKTNMEIRISILEILYMSIFRQSKQLWLFRPKFTQKWT